MTAADIRATRARLDETQKEFGQRLGVDRSTVACWEKSGPPNKGAARMALQRVVEEIAGGTDDKPPLGTASAVGGK